mgnify:CR=1 FL=1
MASPVPADRLDELLEETLVESAAAAFISIFSSLLDDGGIHLKVTWIQHMKSLKLKTCLKNNTENGFTG